MKGKVRFKEYNCLCHWIQATFERCLNTPSKHPTPYPSLRSIKPMLKNTVGCIYWSTIFNLIISLYSMILKEFVFQTLILVFFFFLFLSHSQICYSVLTPKETILHLYIRVLMMCVLAPAVLEDQLKLFIVMC